VIFSGNHNFVTIKLNATVLCTVHALKFENSYKAVIFVIELVRFVWTVRRELRLVVCSSDYCIFLETSL